MSRKKLSTTIYVTPEQNDQLKLLHARTKVPIAVYIREGIDMVLQSYAHLLPGQLSLTAETTHHDELAPRCPVWARPQDMARSRPSTAGPSSRHAI